MARVVVVGGGFGGLSAAARLAKLRHEIVLLESTSALGGRLLGHRIGDTAWQLSLDTVTLPGVLRDLFRNASEQLSAKLLGMKSMRGSPHCKSGLTSAARRRR